MRLVTAALVGILAPACRAVVITPEAIRGAHAPGEQREQALALWRAAIDEANAFLESDFRVTLPPGRFELRDDEGMRFVAVGRTWPLRVECTTWGDICVASGFDAQERSWGFVVGRRPPRADRRVDNSLFRDTAGSLRSAPRAASLILHEATHTVHHEGTVGFWTSLAYYLEVLVLWRYETHSAERHANGTSEEFEFFLQARHSIPGERALEAFHRHLGERHAACRHGQPLTNGSDA